MRITTVYKEGNRETIPDSFYEAKAAGANLDNCLDHLRELFDEVTLPSRGASPHDEVVQIAQQLAERPDSVAVVHLDCPDEASAEQIAGFLIGLHESINGLVISFGGRGIVPVLSSADFETR